MVTPERQTVPGLLFALFVQLEGCVIDYVLG